MVQDGASCCGLLVVKLVVNWEFLLLRYFRLSILLISSILESNQVAT